MATDAVVVGSRAVMESVTGIWTAMDTDPGGLTVMVTEQDTVEETDESNATHSDSRLQICR